MHDPIGAGHDCLHKPAPEVGLMGIMPESGGGTCLPWDPTQPQDQETSALIHATKLPEEVRMDQILERLCAAWCSPQMHEVSLLVSYCALGTALAQH